VIWLLKKMEISELKYDRYDNKANREIMS
jgi:hypothetical protein